MSASAAMERALKRRQPPTQVSLHRIPAKTLAVFTRQWSALMIAGIPLVQAFQLLGQSAVGSRQTRQSWVQILQQLQQDVSAGSALHLAFQKHPHTFNSLYCSILQAGESAGILDTLLVRLANTLEAHAQLKAKVQHALIYPACILLVACGVLSVILIWVVPLFEAVFQSMGAALPNATQHLIHISRWLSQWGLAGLALLGCTAICLHRAHRQSLRMRLAWESVTCAMPLMGSLMQSHRAAKWALTLSALLEAGIPISEALQPAADASGSVQLQTYTSQLMQHIQEGSGLNLAMSKSKLFPSVLIQMCAIGEETGSLALMLEKAAQLLMADLNQHIAQLTTLLEPLLMVLLGGLIGGMMVALYLPIFNLGQVF